MKVRGASRRAIAASLTERGHAISSISVARVLKPKGLPSLRSLSDGQCGIVPLAEALSAESSRPSLVTPGTVPGSGAPGPHPRQCRPRL
jgi:hypothetical protein